MRPKFIIDEHFRGVVWKAVVDHNRTDPWFIDAVRVGDPADLPLGSKDSDIVAWAEAARRIIVSNDRRTMIRAYSERLQQGASLPGLFLINRSATLGELVDEMAIVSEGSELEDYDGFWKYVP